jgi:hypothetical protein
MTTWRALLLAAATLPFLVFSTVASAQADQITLRPVADTSLLSAYPTYNFGGGRTFTAGGRPLGGTSRALLLFDLTPLPADAIIVSASLRVTVVDIPTPSVNSVFDLHRLTASWGEGNGSDRGGSPAGANEATWMNRFGTSGMPWTIPGGDFLPTVSASVLVRGFDSSTTYTFDSTPNLVADLQGWLSDPADNFGWLLESESESIPRTIRRFAARTDLARSPLLTIQYTVVPEPSGASILILGFAVLAWKGLCRFRFQQAQPNRVWLAPV